MPASMIRAPTGSSPNVIGRRIAMVAIGPTPGSTPTRVPTRQPAKQSARFWRLRATVKPSPRFEMISLMRGSDIDRRTGDDEDRHRLVQEIAEQDDAEGGHQDRENEKLLRPRLVASEPSDEKRQRPGDGKAEPADRHGKADDSNGDEDRPAQVPALEGFAFLEQPNHDERRPAQCDRDGEPPRQHGGPHGPERALGQVADGPDREQA